MRAAALPPRRLEWGALALLAVVKLGLLAVFGPTWESDWTSYSDIADTILRERGWLTDAGLDRYAVPPTLFRSLGYPLVVAALRGLLGPSEAHLYLLVCLQIGVSLCATALVWRLAALLLASRWLALVVAFGQATGIGMLYDQSLLPDSLFASAFITLWAAPLIGLLRGSPASPPRLFGLGVLAACACLLRGNGLPFLVLLSPPLLLWLWRSRSVAAAAAWLGPVAAVVAAVMAWNVARTGEPVLSTGAQFVLIQAMVKAEARGHVMFDGDTVLDRTAREHLKEKSYAEVLDIVAALFTEHRVDALESARLHKALYLRSWLRHPGAMLQNTMENFDESIFFQVLNPLDNAFFYSRLVTGDRLFPGISKAWKQARGGDPVMAAALLATGLFRVVTYGLVIVLTIGGPVLLIRRWRILSGRDWAALYLWGLFFGYTLALCAIHIAARHMPAVAGAGLLAALYLGREAWRRRPYAPA
ncbi:hypothetical protein [Magnetospirillum sp. UT-4]|uniref:hypothetical protein n=1 Tax=Magnetospirillum sp. UT-4 TaxID=2681467 RepID=UPI0013807B11|nr:hypothetical protein [Magnetospirillum sp. UT-4]CAA7612156.1 membrane hypothetical protein [Magnetospirillum sp. UT-4]